MMVSTMMVTTETAIRRRGIASRNRARGRGDRIRRHGGRLGGRHHVGISSPIRFQVVAAHVC
jgi:hypothetical protein